jgi:hypothetical protein
MKKISKWSEFQINESFKLILEANLELMPNLIKTLQGMESPVAKFIIDLNERDLNTDINKLDVDNKESGYVTYYPQKKLDSPQEDLWIVKDDGSCYSSWSLAAKYFGIIDSEDGDFESDCENGQIGKIIKSDKYYNIRGYGGDHIICHFRTLDGKDVIINMAGLEKYNPIEKYKQSGKVGRVINKILNLVQQNFTSKDIEDFSNEFKSKTSKKDFELVSGEDIRYWYLGKRYNPIGGPLNGSCMRYDSCQEYLDIYVNNTDVCQLLILRNKENQDLIDGRALVWELDSGETLMDRIYYTSDFVRNMFIEYAEKNNWYYKKEQNSSDLTNLVNKEGDILIDVYVSVNNKINYEKFPYMDTLKYWDRNKDKITTDSSWSDYPMEDTEGGDGGCSECGGTGRVDCPDCEGSKMVDCDECNNRGQVKCDECDGDGEVDCPECDGEGEIDDEKCTDCGGKGKIECSDCDGDGDIECSDCDGEGERECGGCEGYGKVDCPEC